MLSAQTLVNVAALFASAAVASCVLVLKYSYMTGAKERERRFAAATANRLKRSGLLSAAELATQRKKSVSDRLKDMEARKKAQEKVSLRLRLERAGVVPDVRKFWMVSAGCGLVCAIVALLFLPSGKFLNASVLLAGVLGTFALPRFILSKMIERRQKKFQGELANAIDIIVRGVKSGMPLNECLQTIAAESPEPIRSEFRTLVEQQKVGVSLSESLERLINRMPLAEVKFLSVVIAIQQQAGGNLSEALSNRSGLLRDRVRMKLKVKALSAEAQSSAMVLGSMPPGVTLMIYMSTPDYIAPLFNSTTGNIVVVAALAWMGMGILAMAKMINFKF